MLKQSAAIIFILVAFARGESSFAQGQPKDIPDANNKDATLVRAYEPPDKSFQMYYPADWKVVPNGAGGTAVTFLNEKTAKGGKVTEMTTLSVVGSKGATLQQLSQAIKDKSGARAGFTPIEDGDFTVGDWKTHRFVFDLKSGETTMRGIQFVMIKDPSAYIMTFYMSPEKYGKEAEDRAFKICGQFTVGAKQPVVAAKVVQFENKEFGFTLSYPSSWVKATLDQKGVALVISRRASAGKVPQIMMVMADNLDPDEKPDLKEMEQKLVESSKSSLKDGKVIEATDSKFGGEPARRVTIGGTRTADDHQGRVILTFCIKGRSTFGLMVGGPVEDFEAAKGDFDKVLASFTFASTAADAKTAAGQTKPAPGADIKPVAKPAAGPTAFDAPALGLKLSYPATWTAHKSPDPNTALVLLSTPTRPGARPATIVLTTEAVPAGQRMSLREMADGVLGGAKASMPDMKPIESTDIKVGVEKGRRIVISAHAPATRAEMRGIYVMFQHGSDTLVLNGQCAAEDFDSLKEAFDGMVSSMELSVPTPKRGQ